jgi:hypothetical protein
MQVYGQVLIKNTANMLVYIFICGLRCEDPQNCKQFANKQIEQFRDTQHPAVVHHT